MTTLWLRIREWLGWGRSPDDLRLLGNQLLRATGVAAVGYGLLAPLFFLVAGNFYKPFGAFVRSLFTTRVGLFYGGLITILVLLTLIPAVTHRWLARRGEGQLPVSAYGRCYEVTQGRSDIFAQIGSSEETAQWYHLPLAWEAVVEPGDTEFELIMNPATGFVERLRRLGESPKELRQFSATEIATGQAGESYYPKEGEQDAEDTGEATPEQRRELKQLLRAKRTGWGLSPDYLALSSAALVALGLLICGMFVGLAVILYGGFSEPDARDAGLPGFVGLALFALFTFACATYSLWLWWPTRNGDELTQIEGTIVAWSSYRDLLSSRGESLIQFDEANNTTYIFRIHRRWRDRITARGQRLRISYLPISGYVEDLRIID